MRAGAIPILAAFAALGVLGVAHAARADGLSFQLEPSFSSSSTRRTAEGQTTGTDQDALTQRYRLSLDRALFPKLAFLGGALVQDSTAWTEVKSHARTTDLTSSLRFGDALLGGTASYTWRERALGLHLATDPRFYTDTASAALAWRPLDLPALTLRLDHVRNHDDTRTQLDTAATSGALGLVYAPDERLTLSYSGSVTAARDLVRGIDSRMLAQGFNAAYADRVFADRTSVYVSYAATHLRTSIDVWGAGGLVATQVQAASGLAIIEPFGSRPAEVQLEPNGALVDGNVAAGAGVNIGFGPRPTDDAYRDVGAGFALPLPSVNTIWLWVSKELPPEVSGAFTFEVWRSDDNRFWALVERDATRPDRFEPLQNRFELAIRDTTARHLKIVTRPLAQSATTDPAFAEIQVTELQFFRAEEAEAVRGTSSAVGQTLTATARTALLRSRPLTHDFAATLARAGTTAWSVTNGVSYAQRLSRMSAMSARVARTDTGNTRADTHAGAFLWGGSVSLDPLATLANAFTYGGQWADAGDGATLTNTLGLYSRAELYRGLSLLSNLSTGWADLASGQQAHSSSANATLTAVPHRSLSVGSAYQLSVSDVKGGGTPRTTTRSERVDLSAAYSPFSAFGLTASIGHVIAGEPRGTLASVGANGALFPGGTLRLSCSYTESFDSAASGKIRSLSPGLRWEIRRGAHLSASYVWSDTRAPDAYSASRAFSTQLRVAF